MIEKLSRREALQRSCAIAVGGLVAGSGLHAAVQPEQAATTWPMYHGPLGNSSIPESGARLLDDFNKARLLWDSQEKDLPVGKLRSNGNPYSRPSGGMAGLIVAERSIYFAYFQPSGKVAAANWQRPGVSADRLIAADDVVLAVDAANGRTRWKTVLAGKGVNHAPTKRAGWAVTPAYHDGRVFSLGTTGRLYALDAGTGKLLWERSVGAFHERMEALKKNALAQRQMGHWPAMRCSLTVAQNVLVVPDYVGARDIGLIGIDPRTGRTLWQLPNAVFNMAPPAVWHGDGRAYLLAGSYSGHLRLVEPATGKVLWDVGGLGPLEENLAPSARHVVVNVKVGERAAKLYGAYRLDVRGATRAWSMPDRAEFHASTGGDGAAYRRVSALGDRFVIHRVSTQEQGKRMLSLWAVDAESGKVLHELSERIGAWPQSFHALGNRRLLNVSDASHCNPGFALIEASREHLRHVASTWSPTSTDQGTSGYEVPMPYPILDGMIYLRTSMGLLRCYDLRA